MKVGITVFFIQPHSSDALQGLSVSCLRSVCFVELKWALPTLMSNILQMLTSWLGLQRLFRSTEICTRHTGKSHTVQWSHYCRHSRMQCIPGWWVIELEVKTSSGRRPVDHKSSLIELYVFPKMKFLPGIFFKSFSKDMQVINYDCIKADLCSCSGLFLVLQASALN